MRRCRRFGGLDDLKLYRRAAAIKDQNFHRCLFIGICRSTILQGSADQRAPSRYFIVAYFSCVFETRPRVFPSLTIMLETGEIKGFPMVGDYASYCRCVGSQKLSNRKKKAELILREN